MSADVIDLPTLEAEAGIRVGGGSIDTDIATAIIVAVALAVLVGLRVGWPNP